MEILIIATSIANEFIRVNHLSERSDFSLCSNVEEYCVQYYGNVKHFILLINISGNVSFSGYSVVVFFLCSVCAHMLS